jgi:hypothetical protein
MTDLVIRIRKNADGSAVLSCQRPDGSVTWQRQTGIHGRFFPIHDLTHYAVETVLGHRRGFYGLVAEGWNVTDFGAPWPRGRIPSDADPSELIVGFLDAERAAGVEWPASDLNDTLGIHNKAAGWSVTQGQLNEIRAVRRDLLCRWDGLPHGETLELGFERTPAASES